MAIRAEVVKYGTGLLADGTSQPLVLSLYRPQLAKNVPMNTGDTAGFVVMMHGGGFDSGNRDTANFRHIAKDLVNAGYIVASIDYRLLSTGDLKKDPLISAEYRQIATDETASAAARGGVFADRFDARFVEGLAAASEDLVTALRWAEAGKASAGLLPASPTDLAAGLGIGDDVKRIVMGFSAGAMTALNVAYALDDMVKAPRIDAVVSLSGALPDPTVLIGQHEPDLLIVHGTEDRAVSTPLVDGLENDGAAPSGIPYQRIELAGIGHRTDNAVATDDALFGQVLKFIDNVTIG